MLKKTLLLVTPKNYILKMQLNGNIKTPRKKKTNRKFL